MFQKSATETEQYIISPISHILFQCTSRIELINAGPGSEPFEELEALLWKEIERSRVKVFSLDVFDTFLLRNDKSEARRFLEMSELALKRLKKTFPDAASLKGLTAEDLMMARVAGMRATYRTRPLVQGCGEGEIGEVLRMQALALALPEGAEDVLLESEIAYEAENLTENILLSRIAKRFRKKGGKVILVSDMYLGARVIEAIIDSVVAEKIHDHLFSSADLVISKRSGKIFSAIEGSIGRKPAAILHLGDSWEGDVRKPRQAGWHAIHFPISRLELERRKADLAAFIAEMDAKGLDTRQWAKL